MAQEQDFELTSELKTYQFKFTMKEETDPQARFEFWYLEQTNYTIDNVKLIKVQEGTTKQDKEQVEIKSGDIITNGSFTNETTGWGTDGKIDIAVQSDQLEAEINAIGDNPYTPQINQHGIKMVDGVTYRVSFAAKAEQSRKMNVAVGKPLTEDPWYIDYIGETKTFKLTSEMKNYQFEFTMTKESYNDAKLTFELGQIAEDSVATTVQIDDVTITPDLSFYNNQQLSIAERVDKIVELEKKEFLVEDFERTQADYLEQLINDHFGKDIVQFKLFENQVNGGLNEVCTALVRNEKGILVPFDSANNAGKINAGIEIINVLTKHFNFKAPIFIDNAESINKIRESESQKIELYVADHGVELGVI
jgi:phage tail tube protein FII